MKRILRLALALVMLLAFAPAANAATIPAGSITMTAQTVDYVSALAGIAKPVSATHYENERFAVLVTINVPSWYDTTNMSVLVDKVGLSIDSATPVAVATGNYLIFGTLYSTSGKLTITLQDNALNAAANAQALWAALYGDRTVSACVDFAPAVLPPTTYTPVTPVLEVPQTGDKPAPVLVPVFLSLATLAALVVIRRRKAE